MALNNITDLSQSGVLVPGLKVYTRTDLPQIVVYEGSAIGAKEIIIREPGRYLGVVRRVLRVNTLSPALIELEFTAPRFVAFSSVAVEIPLPVVSEDRQKEQVFRSLVASDTTLYNNLAAAGAALRIAEQTVGANNPQYLQLKARYDQQAAAYNARQQQLDNSLLAQYQRAQTSVVDGLKMWLRTQYGINISGTLYEIGALPALFWPIVIGGAVLLGLGALSYAGLQSALGASQSANGQVVSLTNDILALVPPEKRAAVGQKLTQLVDSANQSGGLFGSLEKLLPWIVIGGGGYWLFTRNKRK